MLYENVINNSEKDITKPPIIAPTGFPMPPTIAEAKMEDLNANDLDAAVKIIAGTARSMGVTVEN